MLERVPLSQGLAGLRRLELARQSGMKTRVDPRCPICGLETDEGEVRTNGSRYLALYHSCGHQVELDPKALLGRSA